MDKITEKAKIFAYNAHKNQKRKGKESRYTNHLDLVYTIISSLTEDSNLRAGAWLHDTVEDTEVSLEDIKVNFNSIIFSYVKLETEDKHSNLSAQSTWKIRKEEQLNHLRNIEDKYRKVLLITFADKFANLLEIQQDYYIFGNQVWDRFNNKNKNDHYWYYKEFLDIFKENKDLFEKNQNILNSYQVVLDTVFENIE